MRKQKVLFVCYGNACRSQMAEGFARAWGSDIIEAASAGFSPVRALPRYTISVMAENGIDITGQYSKSVLDMAEWAPGLIVNMSGVELPVLGETPVIEWDVYDPYTLPESEYRKTREQVAGLVKDLLDNLRRGK